MIRKTLFIALPFFLLSAIYSQGQVLTEKTANGIVYRVSQSDNSYKFDSAVYHVFIPNDIKTISGVFIHQHGCTMEGRGYTTAFDIQYQAFAKKWNLAIVGPDLYSAEGNCHDWRDVETGSVHSLVKSLEEIGVVSGHNQLSTAQWLLWGHSGGGYWAVSALKNYPERIMSVFAYSPAFNPKWNFPEQVLKIPIMIRHAGKNDLSHCYETAVNLFNQLRKKGGEISVTHTPEQNHNFSYVRYIAIPFFESVLAQKIRNINAEPWLGDTLSLNTYKASEYKGNKNALCWFPDSAVAAKWKEYVSTGTVVDKTPPPAPYGAKMKILHSWKVLLTWRADADIESGVKHFNIYKGNNLVARYPENKDYQWFDTNGDDAIPVETLPEMKLELNGFNLGDEPVYISTVNRFLLESAKTLIEK